MSETRSKTTKGPLAVKLWITGFRSEELKVADLWRITWHPLVVGMSVFLGCSYTYLMYLTFFENTLTLVYVVATGGLVVLVNNTSVCAVFWAIAYTARFFRSRSRAIVIPTFLVVLAVCPVSLSMSAFLSGSLNNPAITAYAWETIPLVTIFYVVVSDVLYFFLFRYVLPNEAEKMVLRDSSPNDLEKDVIKAATESVPLQSVQTTSYVQIGGRTLEPRSIILLEAQGNYLRVVTEDSEFTERHRISQAIKTLAAELGFTPHRSFWIAFDQIDSTSQFEGRMIITMQGGERVPVAGTKTKEVRCLLEKKLGKLGPQKQ